MRWLSQPLNFDDRFQVRPELQGVGDQAGFFSLGQQSPCLVLVCARWQPEEGWPLQRSQFHWRLGGRQSPEPCARFELVADDQDLLTLDKTMSHARKWVACEQLAAINKRMNGESAAWRS